MEQINEMIAENFSFHINLKSSYSSDISYFMDKKPNEQQQLLYAMKLVHHSYKHK